MIKDRLLALPGEIEEKKIGLIEKQNELQSYREQLKMWELTELSNISSEQDENGKARYSNDTKRKAELQNRIETSNEYSDIEVKVNELDREVGLASIKLEKSLNEQGNLRAICRLEGAE